MRLVSVNVARPSLVEWNGELVETGIYKRPVTGPVAIVGTTLEGDGQADLTVHGGADMAIYAYASEHYPRWRYELGRDDLDWGMFGENFTTEGLDETSVRVGDVFAVGTAELEVSQPRLPCFKLGLKFGDPLMVRRFMYSGRLGFYLRVRRVGKLAAGDAISRGAAAASDAPTIAELATLEREGRKDIALLDRAVRAAGLSETWRRRYAERLAALRAAAAPS